MGRPFFCRRTRRIYLATAIIDTRVLEGRWDHVVRRRHEIHAEEAPRAHRDRRDCRTDRRDPGRVEKEVRLPIQIRASARLSAKG